MRHRESADRIAKVVKAIWRKLVEKGKLPPPHAANRGGPTPRPKR